MKRENTTVAFEIKAIGATDDGNFTFEGYASTFGNKDFGDDIVVPGAFKASLKQTNNVPILWQHSMHEPIGKSIELTEDDKGLFLKGILPKDDDFVKGRVIPQMKIGSIKEMSIGYFIKDSEMQDDIRYLKEVELFEVSLVTKAMNPRATVTGFKAIGADLKFPLASREREWDAAEARDRIRRFTDSEDGPTEDYRKYFMYYDSENSDTFGAYKLPFADIIDGKPMIVPRAIFAIAGVLNGGMGGVDLPNADRVRIKEIINKLYKRMADEFGDESLTSPLETKMTCLKDIEQILKNSGFSNTEAKTIISKVKEFSFQRDVENESLKKDQCDAEALEKGIAKIREMQAVEQLQSIQKLFKSN